MTARKESQIIEDTKNAVTLEAAKEPSPDGVIELPTGGFFDWQTRYQEVQEALFYPFPEDLIKYRKGGWDREKNKQIWLRYVEIGHYKDRLNGLAWGNWSSSGLTTQNVQYEKFEKDGSIGLHWGFVVSITITVFGVSHEGVSDVKPTVTAAYAAAFKRGCLLHGLGHELYDDDDTPPEDSGETTAPNPAPARKIPPVPGASKPAGYPRPSEGQIRYLYRLGVSQAMVEQKEGGVYTITGDIGRAIIDRCKDGQETVAAVLESYGIKEPSPTQNNGDGYPVQKSR